MTTLMPILSLTGLVLLLLTAAPSSCNKLTPGSHLHSFFRDEVKDEGASAPGYVIDNEVDVKGKDFVEKKTADDLTEEAERVLKNDVLQTLKTPGLNSDERDGLPLWQSVERGSNVTSSRAARRRRNVSRLRSFRATFTWSRISSDGNDLIQHYSKHGSYQDAVNDFVFLCPYCLGNQGWIGPFSISVHRARSGNGFITINRPESSNWDFFHYVY